MFKREKCDYCGECLARCAYLNYDLERAKFEFKLLADGQFSPVLEKCVTCFACEEFCPKYAHPFDLILEQMEASRRKPVSEAVIEANAARYLSKEQYVPPAISGTVMSGCVFPRTHPRLFQGPLYDDVTILKGRPVFCHILFLHMGDRKVIADRAPEIIANLEKTGAEEIVFFHDDCYSFVTNIAPGLGIKPKFHPVHLVEYTRDWLKQNPTRIRKLGTTIAYQRPCASRLSPQKEDAVDEVFDLIGVNRVSRHFDRTDALCCGGALFLTRGIMPKELQQKNLQDALDSGVKELVCLCPMCMEMLKPEADKLGITLTFFTELVQRAIA